jgi:hypothetical protein
MAEPLSFGMIRFIARSFGVLLLVSMTLVGCDKLGLGNAPQTSTQRPGPQELKRIHYMSQAPGPDGRNLFDHLDRAKSCRDLELAMRWNRPPDVQGGPFNEKMVYLSAQAPADLPKGSEVFVTGTIKRGEALPSGAWGWSLALSDGSEIQAIEPAEYWQKQEQQQDPQQQKEGAAAIVKPNEPGRKLCANGIYQGMIGKSLKGDQSAPLVEVLFAIDRRR